jgi:hypothetical protein
MKISYLLSLSVVALMTSLTSAQAQTARATSATKAAPAVPSATATFTSTNIAVGVGYSWGHGVLTYRGTNYPFTVKGLNALGIGASTMNGTAEIFNLRNLSDFAGVYGAAGAVATVGTLGASGGALRNTKGVEMRLNTQSEGLELSLAISGVNITLDPR